jgi:hypothetical protein
MDRKGAKVLGSLDTCVVPNRGIPFRRLYPELRSLGRLKEGRQNGIG